MSGRASGGPAPADQLTLIAAGQRLTGWQSVRVSRGIDYFPSHFSIALTEKFPPAPSSGPARAGYQGTSPGGIYVGADAKIVVKPGDACQVLIGGDLVLTGYIESYDIALTPLGHVVQISGRSKCADLVDCSAIVPNLVTTLTSLQDFAQQLAQPFGITVKSLTGNNVPIAKNVPNPPVYPITPGQTPFELIEMVARYASVVVYDDVDGNLLLADVGTRRMASGFVQGVNVEDARCHFSLADRYSVYQPMTSSVDVLELFDASLAPTHPPIFDKGVPRYRPLIVWSEQTFLNRSVADQRAQWEMVRRMGRSQQVRLTCDSWRDAAGTLWALNALAPIDLPALKIAKQTWAIAEVTYRRDADGTHADLVLMPKEGLAITPTVLQLFYATFTNIGAPGAAPGSAAAAAGDTGTTQTPRGGAR